MLFDGAVVVFTITLIANFFRETPTGVLATLAISLFSAILFGILAVRRLVVGPKGLSRDELLARRDRRKHRDLRRLFNGLMDEGTKTKVKDQTQFEAWAFRIECAVGPLIPDREVLDALRALFKDDQRSIEEKRQGIVHQLEAIRLRYGVT